MKNKRFGAFSSSANSEELGVTIRGIIIGASAMIIWVAHLLGFNIINAQVSEFATVMGTAITSLVILFGLLQKVFIALYDKFAERG